MTTVLRVILKALISMNPAVRGVLALTTVLLAVNTYINNLWAALFIKIDTLVAISINYAYDISPMSLVNSVFPLDTMLSYISLYLAARVLLVGIRTIKSFIPGLT